MTEQNLVIQAIETIKIGLGYRADEMLSKRDYDLISEAIHEKTEVLISDSTLRRLEKGAFNKVPQTNTLNALARQLDFKNWQDFRNSIEPEVNKSNNKTPNQKSPANYIEIKKLAYLSILLMVLACISWFGFKSFSGNNEEKAQFSFRRTSETLIPNTVVFNYDIREVKGDSFFIQQSWDKKRRVAINKTNHVLTDIYYEPGYHDAKLIADDKIIKRQNVVIPTKGWFYYAKEADFSALPTYVKTDINQKDFGLTIDDLDKSGIRNDTEKYVYYANYPAKPLAQSDNFRFKIKAKVSKLRNDLCPFLILELPTEKNVILYKAITEGCENTALAQIGFNLVGGDIADLSWLKLNVLEWNEIEVLIKNNTVSLLYNGKQVHSFKNKEGLGNLTGLVLISNGIVEVENYEISDLNGKVFMNK